MDVKHPVLRVKKGAPVYDDAAPSRTHPDVLTALRARRARADRSLRRRRAGGRGLLIVLLAAVGLFIVWTMTQKPATDDRGTAGGWQAILRATHSADTLILGVTFIAREGTILSAGGPPDVSIDFSVTRTDVHRSASGALDRSPLTIRADIPFAAGMTEARAVVKIGTASVSLRTRVPGP